jgi:hypothetical protein
VAFAEQAPEILAAVENAAALDAGDLDVADQAAWLALFVPEDANDVGLDDDLPWRWGSPTRPPCEEEDARGGVRNPLGEGARATRSWLGWASAAGG